MKQLYTLEEVFRYADEVRRTEQEFRDAIRTGQAESADKIKDQLHVMREFLLRMHENLDKYGPLRYGFFSRWIAARETRKLGVTITGQPITFDSKLLPKRVTRIEEVK